MQPASLLFYFMACVAALPVSDSSSSSTPLLLQPDDIIVVAKSGNVTIMKESEFEGLRRRDELNSRRAVSVRLPDTPFVKAPRSQPNAAPQLSERCEQSTELQVLARTSFLQWDVPMSNVVSATTGSTSTVAVTSGFMLANAVTLGATVSPTLIAGILSSSFSIQATRTWTTTYNQAYTFVIPAGQYGLVVSNPNTQRISGNTLSGCTNAWDVEPFQCDSYQSESFDSLSWVEGIIRLCVSTSYPVPYCVGTGSHY